MSNEPKKPKYPVPTNLKDKRAKYDRDIPRIHTSIFKKKLKKALGFVRGVVPMESSSGKSSKLGRRLSQHFLNTGLGTGGAFQRYLRHVLLDIGDNHFDMETGKCKAYFQNSLGVSWAMAFLNDTTTHDYDTWVEMGMDKLCQKETSPELKQQIANLEISFFVNRHKRELMTGNFHYEDKSNRYWNPIQSIRKDTRKELYVRFNYNHCYDVETCAPTLIYQLAQKVSNGTINLPSIKHFLENKQQFRQQIADEAGIEVKVAKEIILAMFCGASLGRNYNFATFGMVEYKHSIMEKLVESNAMIALRNDIRLMWKTIRESGICYITYKRNKAGKMVKTRMSPKQKWAIYFKQERVVINAVKSYLDKQKIKYVLEHDGWVTDQPINQYELRRYILDRTDFDLKLDYTRLDGKDTKDTYGLEDLFLDELEVV